MGLAQFGDTVKVEFNLNQYSKSDILENMKRFRLMGSRTRKTGEAITYARRNFFTSASGARGYKPYLVLITSGKSDDNVIKTSRLIKEQGVTVLTIGLGQSNQTELETIATKPYVYIGQSTQVIVQRIKTAFDDDDILRTASIDATATGKCCFVI